MVRHSAVLKAITMLVANCIITVLLILTIFRWQTQRIVSESKEKILLEINESTRQLDTAITTTEITLSKEINNGFMRITRGIEKIDVVYSDLLKEEKKKRVDVLLSDKTVSQRIEDARSYIKKGKYTEAHDLLRSVVDEQPENQEAKFLFVYCLFNKNRMNIENYSGILAELSFLEKNGFHNQEIDEMKQYITTELNALSNTREIE
ncbi:MAG TPA: tetratricopeptide repeat protein [Treponema sp.]|nr:tetratricopeptide repeat protein [Treponema sp.]